MEFKYDKDIDKEKLAELFSSVFVVTEPSTHNASCLLRPISALILCHANKDQV